MKSFVIFTALLLYLASSSSSSSSSFNSVPVVSAQIIPAAAGNAYATIVVDLDVCNSPSTVQVNSQGRMFLACSSGIYMAHPDGFLVELVNSTACSFAKTILLHPNGMLYFGCKTIGLGQLEVTFDGLYVKYTKLLDSNECLMLADGIHVLNNNTLLVACSSSYTRMVDLNTRNSTKLIGEDKCSDAISITHYWDQSYLYIVAACFQGIIQVNFNTSAANTLVSLSSCPGAQSVTRDNRTGLILVACRDRGVLQISDSNVTLLITDNDCPSVMSAVMHPEYHVVVAACQDSGVEVSVGNSLVTLANSAQCTDARYVTFANGYIFAVCRGSGILRLSGSSVSSLVSYSQCEYATSVAVDQSHGSVIVSCFNGIQKIAGNSATLLTNASQCVAGSALWQTSTPNEVLAACTVSSASQRGVLISINTTADRNSVAIVATAQRNCSNFLSLYSDQSSDIYIVGCGGLGGVFTLNRTSGSIVSVLLNETICGPAYGVDKDVTSNTLYVACSTFGLVAVDLNRNGSYALLADLTICDFPLSVLVQNHTVFFGCRGSGLFIFNGTSILRVLSGFDCPGAYTITHNAVSDMVLVACTNDAGIFMVDPVSFTATNILTSSQVSSATQAVYDPIRRAIYASSLSRGVVALSLEYRCYAGTSWKSGTCVPCEPQYYRSPADLQPFSQCSPCQAGWVAPNAGSLSCAPCPSGSYESKKVCLLCPLGRYQPLSGTTYCNDCAKGSYAVQPGSTECSLCAAGFYSSRNGSVSCSPCNSGSASDKIGLDRPCDGCEAGSYQAGIGQTSCFACPPSFYAEQANSTSCTRCASQVNQDRTACTIVTCDANSQFDDVSNQCEQCPLRTFSSRGGTCTTCVSRTYTPAVGSGCAPCDIQGLSCSGGTAEVLEGFWAFIDPNDAKSMWHDPANPNDPSFYYTYRTVPCAPGFCSGTVLDDSPMNTSASLVIEYCAHPRLNSPTNHLCAQCAEGYLAWGSSCVSCSGVNGGLVFGYLVLSLMLVIFLLYSSTNIGSAGATSIFLFFIQTCALEIGPIVRYLDWIQVANLDPKSAGSCLAPWSAYDQMLFSLLIPIILIAELGIIATIHYGLNAMVFSHRDNNSNNSNNSAFVDFLLVRLRRFSVDDYYVGTLAILLFSYTQVSTASLRYLHCSDVGSLAKLNFSAPTIDCKSDEYKHYLVPVIITIILYIVGFPIVAFVQLWRNRESLYLASESIVSSSTVATTVATSYGSSSQYHWSPFYKMYAVHAWFWQCGVLLRRAAFVVTAVLFTTQQTHQRFMVFAFLHFASLQVHLYVKPYEDQQLNNMETVSYMLLVSVSLMLTAYAPPYPVAVQVMLFVLIAPAAVAMFLLILWQRWQKWNATKNKAGVEALEQHLAQEHAITNQANPSANPSSRFEEAISIGSVTPSIATPSNAHSITSPMDTSNRNIELSEMPISVQNHLSDQIFPSHSPTSDSEAL